MAEGLVLDSWPLLEWIKGRKPTAQLFEALIVEAMNGQLWMEMTRINYGEVIYTICKAPDIVDRDWALKTFLSAPIQVCSIDDALVDEAVELKSRYSFSFADAFAAALAARRGFRLVTGDQEFRETEADGKVRLYWVGA